MSSKVAARKSVVHFTDSRGQLTGATQTLHGLIYSRTATDFGRKEQPGEQPRAYAERSLSAQQRAATVQLNEKALFTDAKHVPEGDRQIACRHLGLQWLTDRASHRRDAKGEEASGKPRFSYKNFAAEASITAHVPRSLESDFRRMAEKGTRCRFEIGKFGALLNHTASLMAAGETRHFAIVTVEHMISLELRVKPSADGGAREYVVNLYDPNRTASHTRLVVGKPEDLRPLKLQDWFADGADLEYFGHSKVCSLFDWPAQIGGAPVAHEYEYLSPKLRAAPQEVHAALMHGRAQDVSRVMTSLLKNGQIKSEDAVRWLPVGLDAALQRGQAEAIAEYTQAVLQAPDSLIAQDDRYRLLTDFKLSVKGLQQAILNGHVSAVQAFTGAVLSAGPALALHHQLDLLWPEDRAAGEPPLQSVCASATSQLHPPLKLRVEEAAGTYLRLILQSSLPAPQKEIFCASAHGQPGKTAARRALDSGNPGVAAAMVCAVLEAVPGKDRDGWLERLGTSPEEVCRALALDEGGSREWIARIDKAARGIGAPAVRLVVPAAAMFPDGKPVRTDAKGGASVVRVEESESVDAPGKPPPADI